MRTTSDRNRLRGFIPVAALVLAISTAGLSSSASAAESPYDIDVILSLTGQGSFIGKINQDMLGAFETMVNKGGGINGTPIHFVFSDDQTSPQVAVQLASGIVARGTTVILGPSISATCRAVAPLMTKGPVDYCLSPGMQPAKGSFVYSVSTSSVDMIAVALRYFRERGWTRIARLTTTDATGQEADAAFAKWLALPVNNGMTIVDDEHFAVADISVTAQMARIKAANPQVVVIWATGTPMGTALRANSDLGLDVPVYVTNSNMTTTQAKQYAPIIPKQYYSAAPGYVAGVSQSPTSKSAQRAYDEAIATASLRNDYVSGIAWDAGLIVTSALTKLGTSATAAQINEYIQHLANFSGISGTYDFTDGSQRGLGQQNLMVMRYDPTSLRWNSVSAFGGGSK
jgi:branched-chain amino acid transport system substrate-binding protein